MPEGFTILITDRNRHVRNFLGRELTTEGYRTQIAADARDLFRRINVYGPPDLLILDLEIPPYQGGVAILKRLQHEHPELPVILHSFATEESNNQAVRKAAAFVEKTGNAELLKNVIERVLAEFYPQRSGSGGSRGTMHAG